MSTLATAWIDAMRLGDFAAAFRCSDRVLAGRDRSTRDDPDRPYHLRWVWDGRLLDGKSVLVRCYHGLGDTIQFSRYLAPLRRRAAHLAVEAQPELLSIMQHLGADELRPFQPGAPSPPGECDIEIMELAHALRLAPTPTAYFARGTSRAGSRLRVGLAWQSGPWQADRSLPASMAARLLSVPDVEFVNLQHLGTLPGLPDGPTSIGQTADRLAGLDLVISVDTMVAHLAGALGVPLWLLLKAEPDWRWLAGGTASPWYLNVSKYRQPRAGDWTPAFQAVEADLRRVALRGTLLTKQGSDGA